MQIILSRVQGYGGLLIKFYILQKSPAGQERAIVNRALKEQLQWVTFFALPVSWPVIADPQIELSDCHINGLEPREVGESFIRRRQYKALEWAGKQEKQKGFWYCSGSDIAKIM